MIYLKKFEQYGSKIFDNEIFITCLKTAKKSKSKFERYGAVLIKDNNILGIGFNRAIAHLSFGNLKRFVKQGMANHAEIEAINDALLKIYPNNEFLTDEQILKVIKGSEIYVAGYFNKTNQIFFKNVFTCSKCLPYLKKYGIEYINVPTPETWIKIYIDDAFSDATRFKSKEKGGIYTNRLNAIIGDYKINFIK